MLPNTSGSHAQVFSKITFPLKNTEYDITDMKNNLKKWAATRTGKVVLSILLLLIIARIALPYVILHYANRELASMDGYYGKINDIDVALYRGAYTIDSVYINKINEATGKQDPFFSSHAIDLSLEWKSLFKGKIAGELVFDRPFIKFTKDKVELGDVARDTSDFRQLLQDLMPIQVNRCEINEGHVMYADYSTDPLVEIEAKHINALAQNLKNTYKKSEVLPATLQADANVYGGIVQLNMKMNPLAENTTFDMDFKVIDAQLPQMNTFFKAYANVDIHKGLFSMYMEAAAKEGKFVGYVKPFIRDLDVLDWKGQDKEDNFLRKVWEGVVGLGGKIFENRKDDDVATKIPLSGSFGEGIKPNVITSLVTVIQNAFFNSLKPSIDNEINLHKVDEKEKEEKKGFFKRIFDRT